MPIPDDIFTETDVSPDTLANLGPLARLAGTWEGTKGLDINPKADGPEHREYTERMVLEPIDAQSNGPQFFYGLRYHTHITTVEEDITFHDQVGYWLWEPTTGLIMQTLAIPRGQIALSSGYAAADAKQIVIEAKRGPTDYGICSTSFLEQAFRTDAFRLQIDFLSDGSWKYISETTLIVHGQDGAFNHRDVNHMKKIAEPNINPWLKIVQAKGATAPV